MIDPSNKDRMNPEEQLPMATSSSVSDSNNTNNEDSNSSAAVAAAADGAALPPPPTSRRRKKTKPQAPPTKDMIPLNPHFQPGKLDVICSRGKFAYNSPGNCWFRTMVEEQMDNYSNARTKTDKSLVVSILVNRVRAANPQGGFVKNFGGRWYRVSDRYSREKVGQQFRDLLHTKYRSSTKAKAEKRKHGPNGETPDLSSCDETSSRSTRARLHEMGSPKPSPSFPELPMAGSRSGTLKMPPLIFDTKKLGLEPPKPSSPALQPRFTKRAPDDGEHQPPKVAAAGAAASSSTHVLDQGPIDLGYLDDFEPLPMGIGGPVRSSRANSLNLIDGLSDSFPSIFNPSDMTHSQADRRGSNANNNSGRLGNEKLDDTDPFGQPWNL